MNRAELKAQAKEQIKGKIGIIFITMLVMAIVSAVATGVLSLIPVVGSLVASIIVTPAFTLSAVRIYLNVANGGRPSVGDGFSGFDDFWAAFKVTFFIGLYTFLWSLLFVIPGIIKAISYSMSMYVLAENKGMSAHDCIAQSKEMTNGHKMDLFVLELSFIGWILLGAITFGIAFIWVLPYMETTYVNAYNVLKPAKADAYTQIPQEPIVNQ